MGDNLIDWSDPRVLLISIDPVLVHCLTKLADNFVENIFQHHIIFKNQWVIIWIIRISHFILMLIQLSCIVLPWHIILMLIQLSCNVLLYSIIKCFSCNSINSNSLYSPCDKGLEPMPIFPKIAPMLTWEQLPISPTQVLPLHVSVQLFPDCVQVTFALLSLRFTL